MVLGGINNVKIRVDKKEERTKQRGIEWMEKVDKAYGEGIGLMCGIQPKVKEHHAINMEIQRINEEWQAKLHGNWQFITAKPFWLRKGWMSLCTVTQCILSSQNTGQSHCGYRTKIRMDFSGGEEQNKMINGTDIGKWEASRQVTKWMSNHNTVYDRQETFGGQIMNHSYERGRNQKDADGMNHREMENNGNGTVWRQESMKALVIQTEIGKTQPHTKVNGNNTRYQTAKNMYTVLQWTITHIAAALKESHLSAATCHLFEHIAKTCTNQSVCMNKYLIRDYTQMKKSKISCFRNKIWNAKDLSVLQKMLLDQTYSLDQITHTVELASGTKHELKWCP